MLDSLTTASGKRIIDSTSGTKISVRSWHADEPRALVVIIPGFSAHAGRYAWVAAKLVLARFTAYAVDLRGRGESDGERFYVEHFDDYVDDVSAAIAVARLENPGLPVFLLGHSAGGVVGCFVALAAQETLAGFICESFSFDLPAPAIALAVLKGLSHVLPHAHVVALKPEHFSRDATVVQMMKDDPLIAGESEAAETIAEMTRATERLASRFGEITLPILILHGTDDKVANLRGSQTFYDNAGSTDKTLRIYDGHFHDLLNDYDKTIVMRDVTTWLGLHSEV